ncbi:unnamed protein product [Nippostrongylus brasiliensis]|uniref:Venom protein n=1 Tax=Nippostrongylus brasiliensis TaxID=27835 RepID=A0A158QZV5_NIPBR|nr:hypothetical protein Q1695_008478 [Nippostrongylus brasiliensis]VDL74349.1 unnamed protein product [Nippostrongylus brasiliensis]
MKCLVFVCSVFLLIHTSSAKAASLAKKATCYTNSDVCVPTTKPSTGILWKDCSDYCVKCKGREHGKCHKVHTDGCDGGYHCKCLGKTEKKSEVLQVAATCRLGL